MKTQETSAYPFKSNFIKINDSRLHYADEKSCKECDHVFLFLHGNPTSSYLWRNIIPHLKTLGRCVAPDLIGFGKSDKPDITYSFDDHFQYIEEFIEKLKLDNIILVLHDWGGGIGFRYAEKYTGKIQGIVFMETFYKPMEWDSLSLFAQLLFKAFRSRKYGKILNGHLNMFLRFVLPFSMYRRLNNNEKEYYMKPFKNWKSRRPIIKFPQELPFRGSNTKNEKIAEKYFEWLKDSSVPKLLLYAVPGVQITVTNVSELKMTLTNLTTANIGRGKHFIQEDHPENIAKEIGSWFEKAIK